MRADLTLESFAVGPANRVAHAAARSVTHPSGNKTPVVLFHGASGLGKTHLLWGIYNAIAWSDDPRIPFYVSAHQILNPQNYDGLPLSDRNADAVNMAHVLLIDDAQFLASRTGAQRYLLSILDTFARTSRMIVVATDADPRRLQTLDTRLIKKLCSGLVVEIFPPDPLTRLAILREKTKQIAVSFTEEILAYLADRLVGNVREMEGALQAIVAEGRIRRSTPTLSEIAEVLHRLGQDATVVPFQRIEKVVCARLGVPIKSMRGASRSRNIVRARHVVIHLARKLTCYSTEEIGQRLGNRSRAAVRSAEKKMNALAQTDDELRRLIDELMAILSTEGGA